MPGLSKHELDQVISCSFLTEFEINAIKQCALEIFGVNVQVFLFGSRVDDSKKGGDIDLYIKAEAGNDFSHKIKFLVALEQQIGEQKIDVVFAQDKSRAIEQQAISTGVLL
ncbi:MAG: nucleotidyltransferase domain-containing protein [Methylococcales bacterium]|nr:nucleotidyltransferase domain-containing protein [Methylococcales bacterium]MDD5630679.1 nucleotidyltransferase domain-containing protein [Methylococcales bacterium]